MGLLLLEAPKLLLRLRLMLEGGEEGEGREGRRGAAAREYERKELKNATGSLIARV
jgi:hypothetical protein